MGLIYNLDLFKKSMDKFYRTTLISEDDESIIYKYILLNEGKRIKVKFDKNELNNCFNIINNNFFSEENIEFICKDNEFEVLVDNHSNYSVKNDDWSEFKVKDENIDIEISNISNAYNIFLFIKTAEKYTTINYFRSLVFIRNNERDLIGSGEINLEEDKFINGFNLIRDKNILSLKIKSSKDIKINQFIDYKYSYLFNLSFNYDLTFIEVKNYMHSFIKRRKIKSEIRNSLIPDVPRKKYIIDILKYYQNAKVIDNLPSKYLSYYHILEYFFEDVHYEEMITNVKHRISNPNFSLNDDISIKEFIKFMEDNISAKKGENYIFNEKIALGLTINKYINLAELEKNLNNINEDIVKYFKNERCEFSNAKKIDFVNYKTIVSRIYKNRNSLVHSKKTSSGRYRPFKDEAILEKEIELIKVLAEMLIINSGELLQI